MLKNVSFLLKIFVKKQPKIFKIVEKIIQNAKNEWIFMEIAEKCWNIKEISF